MILMLLLSLSAQAAEPGYVVETNPKVYPPTAFQGKGVRTGAIPERVARPDALPGKREREQAFAKVPELTAEVAKMDELDRDLLYVRARTISLKELQNFYPKIAEKKLRQLQKVLARND